MAIILEAVILTTKYLESNKDKTILQAEDPDIRIAVNAIVKEIEEKTDNQDRMS